MKQFKRLVGLLLCLAMVLSIVPATVTSVSAADADATYEKINLSGTVAGTCSTNAATQSDPSKMAWYSTTNPSWKNLNDLVDGNLSNEIHYNVSYSEGERGDFYVDLTKKYSTGVTADQLKLHYVGYDNSVSPAIQITLYLTNGQKVEKTFTTNWSGVATNNLVWNFDETYELKGVYVWSTGNVSEATKRVSFGEFELYKAVDNSFPEGTETEMVLQKVDLLGTVVGCCSSPFDSSKSYKNQSWYSNNDSSWRNLNDFVDGNYYNELHFGCSSPERGDLYIDLTRKTGSAMAIDQFKFIHGGFGAVPSLFVCIELENGSKMEKTFTLNWQAGVEVDPLVWTFDETIKATGIYVWQNQNSKAYYGDIEVLRWTEVAVAKPDVTEITGLATPSFGYYADGNTDGVITEYYKDNYGPANLIDGDHDSQTRSQSYTYDEIMTGTKVPAILFELEDAISIAGVEVDGYQYGRYNMTDFTIQVYDENNTWVTVKKVKKAFDTNAGEFGEQTEPVLYRFDAVVGTKVRILVTGVTDMGDEDSEQKVTIDSFRIREIGLYEGYGKAPDDSNGGNTTSILDDLAVMTGVPTPTVGYYTDNNTDGAITNYHHSTHTPANMVNGITSDQARSEYYTHAEIASGAKVPVILFEFANPVILGGADIYGYETSRYNMEDFDIQVYTTAGWVTAASVTDAFYVEGSFGDSLSGPLTVEFDQLYTATKMRILVKGISDMTADAGEDTEMIEGGYIRVREINLYCEEGAGPWLDTANLNGYDIGEYVIVYSADEPDYNYRAAKHIRNAIKKMTGRILNIVEDNAAESACEILVGETNRSLSQVVTAPGNNEMKFTIQTVGTKVALEADYFIIAGAAYYFTETYIDDASFDVTVSNVTRAPITQKANNYIMLIGDGMGINQTKLFEAYDVPTTGDFAYSDGEDIFYGYYFPYMGYATTKNVQGTTTDSAAGGTALATGYKTINTYVGKDKNLNDVQNLTEWALSLGMGAAVMTTEEITGATPASFSAHVDGRSDATSILADQAQLKNLGAIIVDDDYYPYYTAEEWAAAEPTYINALNKVAENDRFFLMYEEAYIDKNGHYGNAPWCFRTVYRFNQAIGFFMEFAMYNPDTLVVITADHETGNMGSDFIYTSGDHSDQKVPVFAYGVGADAFATTSSYENTSIARTFAYMMSNGNTSFGDSQYPILYSSNIEPEDPITPSTPTAPTTQPTQTPTLPEGGELTQGEIYKVINNKTYLTGIAGYINASGSFVETSGEGECLVEGAYGRCAYLNQNISGELAAIAEIDLSTTKKIGAIEITGDRNTQLDPTDFQIQVWYNGAWTTVKTVTNAFVSGSRTQRFTFGPVETTKVRLYITKHEGDYCSIGEIELYEVTTGNVANKIDLSGANVTADCGVSAAATLSPAVVGTVADGDKSTIVIFSSNNPTITFNLTNSDGTPTNVSAFSLFGNRSGNRPVTVEIKIQTTAGGSYTSLGTYSFSANNVTSYPFQPYYTELGGSYDVYGLQMVVKSLNYAESAGCALAEIELYGSGESVTPDAPTTPTEPTTPATAPATQPTTPATQPTTPAVQGTGLKIVSPTKITTVFGCYTDGTGANESTFSDGGDGYCVTDGWFGRAGYSIRTSAQGKIALVMTLSETMTLSALELTGNNTANDPVDFDVQAWVNGAWVTVFSQRSNAFSSSVRTVLFKFNQNVTTNKVRILVNQVSNSANDCRLQEAVLFATSSKEYVNHDLTGKISSTDANGANPAAYLVDGDNKDNIFLGSNATVNFGTATTVDGFRLFGYRGNQAHSSNVEVKVKLTADGEYTTIGTYSTGWGASPMPIVDIDFNQSYVVYGIQFNFGTWGYMSGLEVFQYVETVVEPEPDKILVGASYNVHLIEPWALRTSIQFAKNTTDNLIPVSEFTAYGAYAIISNKFEGTTVEELMADADAIHYSSTNGTMKVADETTMFFDFYDGLYSYNLNESIYWVAYFVTEDGTHYTTLKQKSLTDVADSLLDDTDVSESEKEVLQSMKDLKDALVILRGEDADLGHVYAPGNANTGLGDRNTGYQFGESHQMKLIEPWGVRVRVLMRDKAAAAYANYENADDYGLIFFHDKTGKYGGAMTAEQMSAETDAKVYSKLGGNAVINANGVTAVYDQGIYTYELDTELYCLPYIVIDGQYYYPANAYCWNLLGEMVEFSEDTSREPEEIAVFDAMLSMYEKVQNHRN